MIIAIDGSSGVGKGTLAHNLVQKYRFKFLDTGALFRVVSLCVLKGDASTNENFESKAIFYSETLDFDFTKDFRVILNNKDVTQQIRSPEVDSIVAKVAAIPEVRINLDQYQKDFANRYHAEGVILDGRDIGTFITPHAEVKLFLDCPAEIKAKRRVSQFAEAGKAVDYSTVLKSIVERDQKDRERKVRPLIPATDAVLIDTSKHSIDHVLKIASSYIDEVS
ncbi:MAG: (d)CMP kinase [Proteobacteria bacterium]|nr:(d)CMP kinase [Pseudomonadota bacterium]